ncbi:MAG: ABC transporter permease subunit, partial [Actinomycetota bacterium]
QEAARALGMNFTMMMRLIVLPQALRTVIPPLGNLMIAMVKNSAIAAAIAYPELLYQSGIVESRTFETFEIFTGTLVGFLSLTLPLSYAVSRLELRLRIAR